MSAGGTSMDEFVDGFYSLQLTFTIATRAVVHAVFKQSFHVTIAVQ